MKKSNFDKVTTIQFLPCESEMLTKNVGVHSKEKALEILNIADGSESMVKIRFVVNFEDMPPVVVKAEFSSSPFNFINHLEQAIFESFED